MRARPKAIVPSGRVVQDSLAWAECQRPPRNECRGRTDPRALRSREALRNALLWLVADYAVAVLDQLAGALFRLNRDVAILGIGVLLELQRTGRFVYRQADYEPSRLF